MNTLKPQDVVSFFSDEAARVSDEVIHIWALLTERVPFSNRPKHIIRGYFISKIAAGDEAFMTKVAQAFDDMGEGWRAKIDKVHDISGKYSQFTLTHESFVAFNSGGDRRRSES